MKVVGITVLRTDREDPIPLSMACDLSSYGFFQRQVGCLLEKECIGSCGYYLVQLGAVGEAGVLS